MGGVGVGVERKQGTVARHNQSKSFTSFMPPCLIGNMDVVLRARSLEVARWWWGRCESDVDLV